MYSLFQHLNSCVFFFIDRTYLPRVQVASKVIADPKVELKSPCVQERSSCSASKTSKAEDKTFEDQRHCIKGPTESNGS